MKYPSLDNHASREEIAVALSKLPGRLTKKIVKLLDIEPVKGKARRLQILLTQTAPRLIAAYNLIVTLRAIRVGKFIKALRYLSVVGAFLKGDDKLPDHIADLIELIEKLKQTA